MARLRFDMVFNMKTVVCDLENRVGVGFGYSEHQEQKHQQ